MLYTVKEKTQLRLPDPCIPSGLYLHTPSLSQLVAPLGSQPMIPLPPGTLTVEQIYQDRDQFAKLVREVAAPDVGRMGIEILSFTIKVQCDGRTVANLPCPSGSRGLGRRGTFVPMTSQR